MELMLRRSLPGILVFAGALCAQKYSGPQPPKPDVPYLVHADNLVETESTEAKEETRKDEVINYIAGANSPARTPLASPIFLFQADKISPEKLELYRLEVRNGRREVVFSRKKKQTARPLRFSLTRLAENLFRLEVDESLENGEYSLSPVGSSQVFCFQVY